MLSRSDAPALHIYPPPGSLPDGLCKVADRAVSKWSPRIARFMRRVEVSADGCWRWTGPLDTKFGYARTSIACVRMGAHEAAFVLFVGQVPAGLELDHLCRVRHCVNPLHLEAVTREENMRRMRHPWPHEPSALVRCVNGHEYTDDNTYVRTDGHKYCRTCARVGNEVRRSNRRAAAANTAPETIDALAEATAAHLRLVGRWQPGTIAQLLADLPGPARLEQLVGGAA